MSEAYLSRRPFIADLNAIQAIALQLLLLFIVLDLAETETSLTSDQVFRTIGVYAIIFLILAAYFWPDSRSRPTDSIALLSGFIIALAIRAILLDVDPITSTDFHRNLMFGNIWVLGVDPYTTTGDEILQLIQNGDIELIVPYTSSWRTHAYDYPSSAIWLFWLIIQLAITFPMFDAFVWGKLVLNLFDFGSGYLIYRITKDRLGWHALAAQRASLLFLLNPFSVFQVGLEGQFESWPLFTFLISLYFFLGVDLSIPSREMSNRVNVYFGAFFLVLSVMAKYYSLVALPAILWLVRDRRLIARLLGAMVVFGFYLSLPFIVSGPYITNFLNFQADRNANPLLETIPELLGYRIELSFWAYLLCGAVVVIAIVRQNDKEIALGVMALLLTYFLFNNNSLFPWYFLWLLNVYPLIRSEDSYVEVLFWFVCIFIYLVIWIADISFWIWAVVIMASGAILTHQLFPFKA
ncbi:MAG: hypothetical protein ACFFGZ_14645 [Candidatus Thorarchaeota archaeon]